jgi:hypothetical protein
MEEEKNTELSLKLQCGDEAVSFVRPYEWRGSPFSCRALCGAELTTADHSGTPLGGKLEFETSSAASSTFVKRKISDMDSASCRGGRNESDDIIRPGTPRKKLCLSKYQSSILEESFREQSTLSPKHKSALANKLNLQLRQVDVWFQNRRARTKWRRNELECDNLKQFCERLREENRRLEREVQSLRAMKALQSPNSIPLAAATLTMCPSCEGLATKNGPPPPPPPPPPRSSK